MDNKKIGKLIADLRVKQGLTQQELGDKVGVGFRAVSKWERGITLPDIAIVNELSKSLGITSDELLSGKLKNKKKPNDKKIKFSSNKILISVINSIIVIIVLILSLLIYSNKTYIYETKSVNSDEYYVEGKVTFNGNDISIIINKLEFIDSEFSSTVIKNYEYEIKSNNILIFGYGYSEDSMNIEDEIMLKDFTNNFRINYTGNTKHKRQEILKNNIYVILKFTDINNNEIIKEIEISLLNNKNKSIN